MRSLCSRRPATTAGGSGRRLGMQPPAAAHTPSLLDRQSFLSKALILWGFLDCMEGRVEE